MAKQSVSFVERHLEKIVAGVAGAITLTVIALYVVRSPSGVQLSSGNVGPGEIGALLKEEAKRVYQSGILGAKPPKVSLPDYVAYAERTRPSQIDRALAPRLAVAMTPLNPMPPSVKQVDVTRKVRLAAILPPGKPVVFQGRNRATLATPTSLTGDQIGGPGPAEQGGAPDAANTRDVTWVTVAAPVFRAKQRAEFDAAGYAFDRLQMVLTRVQLERQMLLPDGSWSEPPVAVQTYAKYLPLQKPVVRLAEGETGAILDPESARQMTTLLSALTQSGVQRAIWRPSLAPYLDAVEWPPAGAPSIEGVNWDEWLESESPGSEFKGPSLRSGTTPTPAPPPRPTKKETTPRPERPSRVSPRGGAEPGAAARESTRAPAPQPSKSTEGADERAKAMAAARKSLSEAKKALDGGDFDTAARLADEVLRMEGKLAQGLVTEADGLKQKAEAARQAKEEAAAKKRKTQEDRQQGLAEPDVEPAWAHDLSAEPGRTYRYRLRIDVLNLYSMFPRDLADPHDAEKTILASDWSEWSDPVTVQPDTIFFLSQANPTEGATGTATVNLYKWVAGEWHNLPRKKFEVGQPIACDDRKAGQVDTRMTLVEVAADVKRPVCIKPRRDGSFDIRPDEVVQVMVVAGPDGELCERNTAQDRNDEAEFRDLL
ncbi:MAG: hypothetical protein ACPMAQ_13915 [Phycisphaerae bacterium]